MILTLSSLISCSPVAATGGDEEDEAPVPDEEGLGEVEVLTGVLGIRPQDWLESPTGPLRKACVL